MNMQVKEALLQKCQEVEQNAKDQATDNAILDQLRKVTLCTEVATFRFYPFHKAFNRCFL